MLLKSVWTSCNRMPELGLMINSSVLQSINLKVVEFPKHEILKKILGDDGRIFGTAHGSEVFHFFTAQLRGIVLSIDKVPFQ